MTFLLSDLNVTFSEKILRAKVAALENKNNS